MLESWKLLCESISGCMPEIREASEIWIMHLFITVIVMWLLHSGLLKYIYTNVLYKFVLRTFRTVFDCSDLLIVSLQKWKDVYEHDCAIPLCEFTTHKIFDICNSQADYTTSGDPQTFSVHLVDCAFRPLLIGWSSTSEEEAGWLSLVSQPSHSALQQQPKSAVH